MVVVQRELQPSFEGIWCQPHVATSARVSRARRRGEGRRRLRRPLPATGSPSSTAIAIATPPRALPSSFVSATPVTWTASPKSRACWGRSGRGRVHDEEGLVRSAVQLDATTRAFSSSAMRFVCVWRRPAVSMIATSWYAPRRPRPRRMRQRRDRRLAASRRNRHPRARPRSRAALRPPL